MFIHALDEVCGSWAFGLEPGFRFHIGSEFLRMLKDMLESGDLERIILMLWRPPPDVALKIVLPKDRNPEDMLFDITEEALVVLVTPDPEIVPDVLEEMDMAELREDIGEDVFRSHFDGFIVVTGDRDERVIRILEFREVLHPCLEALGGCKEADRNVMGSVIDAVEQGDFLLVAFHRHILPIHDDLPAEAPPIAVIVCDVVVMGQRMELCKDFLVGCSDADIAAAGERTDACSLEVQIQERFFLLPAVINAEVPVTIIAVVPIEASPGSFPARTQTPAKFAGTVAWLSVFLGVSMFVGEKTASVCRKPKKSGAQK